MEKHVIRKS